MERSERIKQIMAERECGLLEAKRIEWREYMTRQIQEAKEIHDLKPILLEMLQFLS